LVGLPILFGEAYKYGATFQSGLGFAGIAIALLGRNNAIGIVLGALLFAFLDEQSNPLQIVVDVSPQIVEITQGVIVLAVVIAYEVVARIRTRLEQRSAGRDPGPGGDADLIPAGGPAGTPGREREVSA
jgi:simple sugar transport system permease protein